ncbi:dihydrodipicolinate synthase family protein [Kriegella aquimaris]|uniref:4-hydroxy-tetrahydrodipicolinate synthase n=1 Tax=Kriegella aquimaris TaxID=192904 RepID=A0A1G9J082_9FLAO|nr:dihydrodipicolinate synthase family protein [Kriegella aquimaris]SDL30870.1 4-hydroxy-tetrahydrodipicolinate synthase [Kriegella aquimaris]
MTPKLMKLPLKGIIPPMITPLLENKELDSKGLKLLIEHLIEGGVHGIFLLGTNGEGPSLDYRLRRQLIKEACKIVNHRILVLVGITDTSFNATVEMANYAKEMGADALVVAPPYYFPVTQHETIDYLKALIPTLPLPFLLYNIPSCTKVNLSVETVKKGKEMGAIGIKDSSGDMSLLYALIDEFKDTPDFSIIAGAELFLSDTILNGGHGAVAGGANCFPKLFVDLYEASLSRDLNKIAFLRDQLLKIHKTIYNVGDSPTKSIQAIKCVLSLKGICQDYMALPLSPLNTTHRNEIKGYLEEFEYSKKQRTGLKL